VEVVAAASADLTDD
jgi:hypothetical protein